MVCFEMKARKTTNNNNNNNNNNNSNNNEYILFNYFNPAKVTYQ